MVFLQDELVFVQHRSDTLAESVAHVHRPEVLRPQQLAIHVVGVHTAGSEVRYEDFPVGHRRIRRVAAVAPVIALVGLLGNRGLAPELLAGVLVEGQHQEVVQREITCAVILFRNRGGGEIERLAGDHGRGMPLARHADAPLHVFRSGEVERGVALRHAVVVGPAPLPPGILGLWPGRGSAPSNAEDGDQPVACEPRSGTESWHLHRPFP